MFTQAFDKYAVAGDRVTCAVGGIDYTATLHPDHDSSPRDADCYSHADIAAWEADEWYYCGVVLTAAKNGIALGELGALWAVEVNYPPEAADLNHHLRDVANDLLAEHAADATERAHEIITALSAS